ncbi:MULTISPECIES: NYN domain-containing protein [unclassified Brevundimonas]|uniref:NYN domain-containing protein n=1 Tax=unclassified Brevundimonas TaxID=2622653 RepID=UPI0025BDB0B7|nr:MULTISPECIES: NYN domain-containing protein [unclassified Brevundimonas]
MDGGFVQKVIWAREKRAPTSADIIAECERIRAHPAFAECDLLRIYFYDAPPSQAQLVNPIDGSVLDLQATDTYASSVKLQAELKATPDFALRMGDVLSSGWRVSDSSISKISKEPRSLAASDLKPNLRQKGVDIRIGLDIARLALKDTVRSLVVVTADADFVPAFKFARREGIRVYLDTMGRPCRPELIEHSDLRLSPIPTPEERRREKQRRSRERQKARRSTSLDEALLAAKDMPLGGNSHKD